MNARPLFDLEQKKVKKAVKVDKRVERDRQRRINYMNKDFFDVRIEEITKSLNL